MLNAIQFSKELMDTLEIGDRQVFFRGKMLGMYNAIAIHYINLPRGLGGSGGGAEGENNRLMLMVTGFDKSNQTIPVEKIQVKLLCSVFDYPLRKKTCTPERAVEYIAEFINRIAREVPPKYTHTKNQ